MIEIYQDYIPIDVYHNTLMGQCTHGASAANKSLFLVSPKVQNFEIDAYCLLHKMDRSRFFRVGHRQSWKHGSVPPTKETHLFLEPCFKGHRRMMNGGNIGFTPDERFIDFTGSRYPLFIHDRTEG